MITTEPYEIVAKTGHDRSPLFLDHKSAEEWLAPEKKSPDELYKILKHKQPVDFTVERIDC